MATGMSASIVSVSLPSLGNKGCGVWVMSSSLPQLLGNYITHNCMYGLAVFCRKDPESREAREGNWPAQEGIGGDGDSGERRGVEAEGREGQENLNEDGELFVWENDLDSEDERHSARRSISVALVESNCMNYNGGNEEACRDVSSVHTHSSHSLIVSYALSLVCSCGPVCQEQRAAECFRQPR